jgi:hypothetical protein
MPQELESEVSLGGQLTFGFVGGVYSMRFPVAESGDLDFNILLPGAGGIQFVNQDSDTVFRVRENDLFLDKPVSGSGWGVDANADASFQSVTVSNGYKDGIGNQVVGSRQLPVDDATDLTDIVSQFNLLLAAVRNHGLIDS